ncbi:MAG: CYTH domain-containing protein [Magnetococcales bacterium]|nr:CYTH domain-containing protein [Magnetococcales bacterium]MBF0156839.1 CYTH domain-containing protein [Magnetococcales bacterium]
MGIEIERRFLAQGDLWRTGAVGVVYRQGFLSTVKERVVRVRLAGNVGSLTIKGLARGFTRAEFNYPLPTADAVEMLDTLCERPLIEKIRHTITFGGVTWEVDEFLGENAGLVIAEVELAEENQDFALPPWVGREVSGESRYFNANLVRMPFSRWESRP